MYVCVVVVFVVSFCWGGGVSGLFCECVVVLCFEVVSFGLICGYWVCIYYLICGLCVLWGLIVRCEGVCGAGVLVG